MLSLAVESIQRYSLKMNEEEKRIVNLYGLLEELEEEGRTEEAKNLRWALFELETYVLGIKI